MSSRLGSVLFLVGLLAADRPLPVARAHALPRSDAPRVTTSTTSTAPTAIVTTEPPVRTAIVIVLDGVRGREVFGGVDPALARAHGLPPRRVVGARTLWPSLTRMHEELGAAIGAPDLGEPMRASGPAFKSLPGYLELFRGRPAAECRSNRCRVPPAPTLLDELVHLPNAKPEDLAVFASWPHVLRAVGRNAPATVSTGRHAGVRLERLERDESIRALLGEGRRAGPVPGRGDFRPDRITAELALRYLELHRPRFLFLSLGEADAFGHAENYSEYLRALTRSDGVVGEFVRRAERLGAEGWPTTLLVTTDHGRDARCRDHGAGFPESANTWLVAMGFGVKARGLVASAVPRYLRDVAPTLRALYGLAPDRGDGAGTPIVELLGE
jgi:hypothetical protein